DRRTMGWEMFEKQTLTSRPRIGRRVARTVAALVGAAAVTLTAAGPATAVPLWPGGPEVPSMQELVDGLTPPGMNPPQLPPQLVPEPAAPFSAPSINPANGETVGVAQPIIIRFTEAVQDRAAAERAIRVTSQPPVGGHFYWASNTQVRWKPFEFWPAHTTVTVKAGDSQSSFTIGDALV